MPLLIVNQSIGRLFADVVASARNRGPIHVFTGVSYDRTNWYTRITTWLLFSFQFPIHVILSGRQYSSLLVVSNPPFVPLLAPLSCRPYSLLLYDLYPHVLAQIRPKNSITRLIFNLVNSLWHELNRFVIPRAECIYTISHEMSSQLIPYFVDIDQWRKNVRVVPPWADTEMLPPNSIASRNFRSNYCQDGLLFLYSGNIGLTHPLEFLLHASKKISTHLDMPDVLFLIIGDGQKKSSLQLLASEIDIPPSNLQFLDFQPYNQLSNILSSADMAVVALDGPAASSSLPSKTFNALACGTPILALAPIDSALAQLVIDHKCGFVVEPGPAAVGQIVDLSIQIARNPSQLQLFAKNARVASAYFTSKNADIIIDQLFYN